MNAAASLWKLRISRLTDIVGPIEVRPEELPPLTGPLVAISSSRLGRDIALQGRVGRWIRNSVMEWRSRGAVLLVARGSAIEPWVQRAAELFSMPAFTVSTDPNCTADAVIESDISALCRDEVAITMADYVDAVYVRRRGKIERTLRQRIEHHCDATTRVAVMAGATSAARRLIANGAVGWWVSEASETVKSTNSNAKPIQCVDDQWTRTAGEWLVHCTRGVSGPWPDETMRQFRDSLLLGDESATQRGPLDALLRILRSGRIVASSTATTYRVVCFSAMSLGELLQRRCYRPQLGRWDYEPYGIAIRMTAAQRLGMKPVVYGDPKQRNRMAQQEKYRFHPVGSTYDWRQECEWRSPASVVLAEYAHDDIRVFAEDTTESRLRLSEFPWPVTLLQGDHRESSSRCKSGIIRR